MRALLTFVFCAAFVAFVCPTRFLTIALHHYGWSSTHVALVTATYPVASFVAAPAWGFLADRFDSVAAFKVILSTITVLSVVVFGALFQVAGVHSALHWLLAWAAVYGLVAATPILALLNKHAAPGAPESVWAGVRGAAAGAYGLGAALIGLLVQHTELGALRYVYATAMLSMVVASVLGLGERARYFKVAHEAAGGGDARDIQLQRGRKPVSLRYAALTLPFLSRHNLCFFSVVIAFGALMGVVQNMLFFYMRDLHTPTGVLGLSVLATVASEVALIPRAKALYELLGVRWLFTIAGGAFIVRMSLYPIFHLDPSISTTWILAVELLHGVTFSCLITGVQMHQQEVIAAHLHQLGVPLGSMSLEGAAQGWFGSLYQGIGLASGTIASGFVYARYGPVYLFAGCACFMALALVLFNVVWDDDLRAAAPKRAMAVPAGGLVSPVL